MSTAVDYRPIALNEHGRPIVAGTRFKVLYIAEAHLHGQTPEQISERHDGLTLAQVHAALSYYYEHKAEFDAEIERGNQEVERLWKETENSPLRQKLRVLGKLP
jgi:uncharacterized protein (DUF433 family)